MEAAPFGCSQFPALRSSTATSSSLFSLHNHIYRKNLKFKYSSSPSVRASAASNSVTLLDYGAGNVRSVRNAIRILGFDIKDVQTPEDILNANRLIFPGVGAFAAAMDVLIQKGMAEALCTYIENDRPFLGICLGLQLLFESSEENGPVQGLGLIPGVIGRFDSCNGFRVPHIGWNALQIRKDSEILDDIGNHHVYFVHSYRAVPSNDNKEWISSTCNYGDEFIASVRRGNVHAVQFHPEKSGDVGLSVLRRFMRRQKPTEVKALNLAKRVIACLDVRANDKGDLVVTKGDQYDVREHTKENEVRNPVELASRYYKDGADEVLRCKSENVFVPLTVGDGIRDFTDANGRHYSSLEVASEYFRSGADKITIGSDAVYVAEAYLKTRFSALRSSSATSSSLFSLDNHIHRKYHSFHSSNASHFVTLVDYGAGNVKSVRNAVRFLGFDTKVAETPEDIRNAIRLIFPGVGAFGAAMDVLNQNGMAEELCTYINNDRPFLGIGLGLQVLFEFSEENGPVQGLGLIPGVVGRFDSSNGTFRVPHSAWNSLQIGEGSEILDDIGNRDVYFAHSYRAMPSNDNIEWITSTCNYGDNFIASVRRGNVHAVQFQPEKSGEAGLSVLKRFSSKSLT